MKKTTWVAAIAACVLALLAVTGCDNGSSEPEPIAVESVTLNVTTLTLAPGAKEKLTATVLPENADDKTVVWSSSDLAVATVDNDGTVTAVSIGEATITARAGDKEATCTVTVKQILVAVESVTLDKTTLTLMRGDTGKLTATVKPDDADDKTVLWSSSNASVATVDNDGTVTAVSKGTATITAQAGGKTATCTVTVKQAVENVALEPTSVTLEPGMTRKLTATVKPDNADDTTVTWSSSDQSVATVDNNGTVTAVSKGTATITATTRDGDKTATCTVTVNPILVRGIVIEPARLTLTRGDTERLTATVTPSNADDTTVTWSSSDTAVATVDGNGTVTAVSKGTATITAQAGDKTATCTVTVNPILVESVSLNLTTLTLTRGDTGKLTATVTPDNADDKTVLWSSVNASVATVDNDGTVTAHKAGEAKIIARAGDEVVICNVTVSNPEGFEIDDYGVLTKYTGSETTVVIPDCVTGIGESAFWKCTSLESVTIPDGVTSIGNYAFYGCTSLESVTIPDGVESIGHNAFNGCTSLESVTIPDGVTSIGNNAFSDCTSLTNVAIPASVTKIDSGTFEDCTNLASVEIPGSVTSIGLSAFHGCTSLASVKIPGSVTSIGQYAFYECESLTNVTYLGTKDGWSNIKKGSGIFWNTNVTEITDKDGVTFTVGGSGNIIE